MRRFGMSIAVLAVVLGARHALSLLDMACPAAFAQDSDVRARDDERRQMEERIRRMLKGATPARPPAVSNESISSESAMAKAANDSSLPLPRDLTTIIVDGQKLRIKNPLELVRPEFERPALFLPQGTHILRFHEESPAMLSEKESPSQSAPQRITRDAFFSAAYAAIRAQFLGEDGAVSIGKLKPNLLEAKENFQSPLTPHLLGNYYFSRKKYKVAEREYWQAIRMNPCFALAHLNLACLYARHSKDLKRDADFKARAAEELHWAEQFNVGDTFGVGQAIASLREEAHIAPLPEAPAMSLENYQSAEVMDAADRRVVGIINAAMKYLPNDIERAKLMVNKAVYFNKCKGKYDLALDAYQEALRVLGESVKDPAAATVVQNIVDNGGRLCLDQWQGGNEEFDLYKEYVRPQ